MAKKLKITWKRSNNSGPAKFDPIIRGLGLRRLNQTVIRSNIPEIRGMVKKVIHLVDVQEIEVEE
ncbi:50S ribosomal protein L30 [bacterium]|nr:50S ribosomal protein L30 [candidate division CSSED10-310 bacterium]